MLETLLEGIKNRWDEMKVFTIMYDYEAGFIRKYGKYNRCMKVGINWKYPIIEEFNHTSTQDDIKKFEPQTVTTKDGYQLVARPIVTCFVFDIKRYYLKVLSDNDNNVEEITAAAVEYHFNTNNYKDIMKRKVHKKILKDVRKSCMLYGVRVRDVSFSTLAEMPSYRLIMDRVEL